jgi:hypothetical protein
MLVFHFSLFDGPGFASFEVLFLFNFFFSFDLELQVLMSMVLKNQSAMFLSS